MLQLITEFADTVAACLVNLTNMGTDVPLLKGSNDPDPLLSERIVRERASQSRAFVDLESDLRKAVAARDANAIQLALVQGSELAKLPDGRTHVTRISWKAAIEAPQDLADLIMTSPNSVCDFHFVDDINGRTCLHGAAAAGELRMVNLCLEHNVEVNRKDVYGRTALHYSSMGGYVDICTRLLDAGADPSSVDRDNFSPLYYAVINGRLECLRVLLKVGKVGLEHTLSDANPLALACQSGHLDVTILLLQYGAKNLPNTNGEYPLHLAAKEGHVEVCKLLCVKTKETLDTPDKYSEWTPLFHAANNGHEGCVKVLLQAGCNPLATDELGRPAIYYAAWFGHIACTFLLYGAVSTSPRRQMSSPRPREPPPSAGRMSPFDLGPDAVGPDTIPSLSLPPPIMPFRIYGHNYLEKSYLVQLALGQPFSPYTTKPSQPPIEITPWTTDPDLRRPHPHAPPSLKLVMSSRSGKSSVPFTLTIPLSDHQDTLSFQIQNLDELSLEFSFYPNFGSKTIGRAAILPSAFQGIQDTRVINLPVLDHRLHIIGRLTIEVCIISPFQDVALQVGGSVETYWKSSAQYSALGGLGSTLNVSRLIAPTHTSPLLHRSATANTPGSVTISSLSGDYLHVVVQVTRDLVPVVYSKWRLPVNGVDVGVCSVSATQFSSIAVGKGLALNSMHTPGTVREWAAVLQTAMLTLEHLLKVRYSTPRSLYMIII
jgi:CDK inhibitor PHO81